MNNITTGNDTHVTGISQITTYRSFVVTTIRLTHKDFLTISLMSIVLIVGVLGNFLVVYVIGFRFKRPLSKPNLLIFILAIVDTVASFTNPSLFIYLTVTGYQRWDFGLAGCKILPTIGPISNIFSACIILIIIIDRDRTVTSFMKTKFKRWHIKLAVMIGFVLSCLSYLHYALHLQKNTVNYPNGMCLTDSSKQYRLILIAMLLFWDVTFILVFSISNYRLYRKVRATNKATELCAAPHVLQHQKKRTLSVIRMVLLMGIVFVVCIFPRDLLLLALHFSYFNPPSIRPTKTIAFINSLLKVLQTSNSTANVFIYSVFNSTFRFELNKMIQNLKLRPSVKHSNAVIVKKVISGVI